MSAKEAAEKFFKETWPMGYQSLHGYPSAQATFVYCRTAIFCAEIIAEAIVVAANKVRVPFGSNVGPGGGLGGGR